VVSNPPNDQKIVSPGLIQRGIGTVIAGVTVLAVPVFSGRKDVKHTLVAAGVTDQLNNTRCVAIAKDMRMEAERISSLLLSEQ
jgi:DNA-binding IclR family transcriptional regulator